MSDNKDIAAILAMGRHHCCDQLLVARIKTGRTAPKLDRRNLGLAADLSRYRVVSAAIKRAHIHHNRLGR